MAHMVGLYRRYMCASHAEPFWGRNVQNLVSFLLFFPFKLNTLWAAWRYSGHSAYILLLPVSCL